MSKRPLTLPAGIRRMFRLPRSRARVLRDQMEEMREHIALRAGELRAQGLSDAEAQARAEERFGDADAYRAYADARAARVARIDAARYWLVEWGQDIRFAVRHFRKAPAFTAVAVLTLALGIGANTAIFSVVHRLLIAPLPYPNGDRIVALKSIGPSRFTSGLATTPVNAPDNPSSPLLSAWVDRGIHSFDAMGGIEQIFLSLLPDGQQDTVSHSRLTADFLALLGVQPALGRMFRADEENTGAPRVAMLSYRWWQRAYGGRVDALGQTVDFEGNPFTIVGVMPRDFSIPMSDARGFGDMTLTSPDVWMPGKLRDMEMVYGRLKRGVSVDVATRELQAIANTPEAHGAGTPQARFAPDTIRVRAMRAQDFLAPREVRAIEVLFAAVGALLLIACANVANLLLVRAWARRREFAVRMGLGAGRGRLIRLALTESVLLALGAGVIGVAIAWLSLRLIIALRPASLDALAGVQVEPAVLFWTAGVSVLTGILFGAAAALFVGAQNVGDLLRSETRSASSGGVTRRIRSALIAGEIALTVALLVATGLLTRSFAALQDTRIGFEPRRLVAIDVLLGPKLGRSPRAPEVRAAIGSMPTAGFRDNTALEIQDGADTRRVSIGSWQKAWVSPAYFGAARIGLTAGRLPNPAAGDQAPNGPFGAFSEEVVVSQSLARRISADDHAIGQRIRAAGAPDIFRPPGQTGPVELPWATVVGIVSDAHLPGPRADLDIYQLYQLPVSRMPEQMYIIRFASVPPDVESVLRDAIHTVDPTIIARRALIGDDYLREALAPTRFTLALLGAFALVALVLSVVGLYGSIAYSVSQRTREIGIRIALGASPKSVTALILSDGVKVLAMGLVLGIVTAVASTRALTGLLYGVSSADPPTFVAIALLVAIVTTAASLAPARRATRIDPVDALRAD